MGVRYVFHVVCVANLLIFFSTRNTPLRGQDLQGIVIEPLLDWGPLATACLEHLLACNSSEKCGLQREEENKRYIGRA